jgi:hypothetical protein
MFCCSNNNKKAKIAIIGNDHRYHFVWYTAKCPLSPRPPLFSLYLFPPFSNMAEFSGNDPNNDGGAPRLQAPRNIHPSQFSRSDQHYESVNPQYDPEADMMLSGSPQSFKHKIGSFVGSYSRTSMTFMAENLSVPISAVSWKRVGNNNVVYFNWTQFAHRFIFRRDI